MMEDSKKIAILKERAEKLSRVSVEGRQENEYEVLKFLLNKELFAIELCYILEVSLLKEYTHLPCTPPFIYGLMNMRRQVFTIVDLSELFSLKLSEKSKLEKVIILKDEDISFAIRTGGILGVETIPMSDIQQAPSTLSGMQTEFLKGITKDGIVLLDGSKLIHAKQLIVDEHIGHHG